MSEHARCPARDPCSREPLGSCCRGRPLGSRRPRLPLQPARRRPRAREHRRRQHVRQGDGARPRRARRARPVGEGVRDRPRDDHVRRVSRPPARRAAAAAGARGDGRRGDGRVPAPLRGTARPAAAVDRDAAARVHPGGARRPHASRRRDRADVDAGRPQARRGSVRRRGGLARLPAAGFRHVAPNRIAPRRASGGTRRPAREARARHLGRDRRGELRGDDRVRLARRPRDRRVGARALRAGRPEGRGARRRECRRPPVAVPSRAPRRAPRRTPTGSCSRSTGARRPCVRVVGTCAGGQPDRRAVSRPS